MTTGRVLCLRCNEVAVWDGGEERTLIGCTRRDGHHHDANCVKRGYVCPNGHWHVYSILQRCSVPGCGWVGKSECFCHDKAKVEEWP